MCDPFLSTNMYVWLFYIYRKVYENNIKYKWMKLSYDNNYCTMKIVKRLSCLLLKPSYPSHAHIIQFVHVFKI